MPLVALDAVVEIEGQAGRREIALEALHRLPGDTPERESVLEPGDLIVAVRLPADARALRGACALSEGPRAHLLRLRRRLGRRGAADRGRHHPRGAARARRRRAEAVARASGGRRRWQARSADATAFRRAAEAALAEAKPSGDNAFKIELARRIVVRALTLAAAGTPARMPALPASPFASVSGAAP